MSYTCLCSGGWTGQFCENQIIDHCASNPCDNGAPCHLGVNDYTCDCPDGWEGKNCDQVICRVLLVRQTGTDRFHDATDNLAGTDEYGQVGSGSFSIRFDNLNIETFIS